METVFVICVVVFIISLIVDAYTYESSNIHLEGLARLVMVVCIVVFLITCLITLLNHILWN